jgi:SAM-dependent methyltransferase
MRSAALTGGRISNDAGRRLDPPGWILGHDQSSPYVKRVDTIRDVSRQREHMWANRQFEDEVSACRLRRLDGVLREWLPKSSPVLEAGCGLGAWVIRLSQLGYDVTGVDNDPIVVERLQSSHPDLDVRLGDIATLPFADGAFGGVMSFGVVEHFPEGWVPVMAETRRVLGRNGILVLTVPMNNAFRRLFAHPVRAAYLHRRFGSSPRCLSTVI